MAVYGLNQGDATNFNYDSGIKYGTSLTFEQLYKINFNDPTLGIKPRHIKVTLKATSGHRWSVDSIRLLYANKAHVIPKYWIPIGRLIKRTKVTLKYTSNELWAIDSLRLNQKLTNRGPTV